MPPESSHLGILTPTGGGDPIPLDKDELVVGRRPTSDVRLEFENVSGKHCVLRFIKGIWNIRDLGSSNGTTLNGQKVEHEQGVMPDDEVGIAGHYYHIAYEPSGPASFLGVGQALSDDEEVVEQKKRHSLLELAGLNEEGERLEPRQAKRSRPGRPPEHIVRPSSDEAEFEDALPEDFKAAPAPAIQTDSDEFLKLIEEAVKEPEK